MKQREKRWYQKGWGILLLIFLWYFTVPVAIIQSKAQRKSKIFMWVGYVFLWIFLFIGIAVSPDSNSNVKKMATINQTKTKENQIEENIKKALESSGLVKYKLERDENLDDMAKPGTLGYRAKTDFTGSGVAVYVDKNNNTVFSIRYADKDYYKEGKILGNLKDDVLTFDEASDYNIDIKEKLKSILKAPSTAKFPAITQWEFKRKDGVTTVRSYVDAQNAFSAMLRSDFQVKYNKDNKITSFIFEGQELIK
jgi:hypothetical protein cdifA_19763